jgi:AcrR family transcriptional regulator
MGRPREHDDDVRAALLAAAEHLVERDGAEALSVRTVADTVGTTTRAIYSVFGSKAGLLEALAARLFELLSAAIDAVELTSDPAADLITASLDGFRRTALEHAALYNLVFLRVVPDLALGAHFQEVAGRAFGRLELLIARVVPAASVAERRVAAHAVHALTEGLATMELRGALGPQRTAARTWRAALTALIGGLQGESSAPSSASSRA